MVASSSYILVKSTDIVNKKTTHQILFLLKVCIPCIWISN